jgi:hypothetical protein
VPDFAITIIVTGASHDVEAAPAGESLEFKHRVYIHDGDATQAGVANR